MAKYVAFLYDFLTKNYQVVDLSDSCTLAIEIYHWAYFRDVFEDIKGAYVGAISLLEIT